MLTSSGQKAIPLGIPERISEDASISLILHFHSCTSTWNEEVTFFNYTNLWKKLSKMLTFMSKGRQLQKVHQGVDVSFAPQEITWNRAAWNAAALICLQGPFKPRCLLQSTIFVINQCFLLFIMHVLIEFTVVCQRILYLMCMKLFFLLTMKANYCYLSIFWYRDTFQPRFLEKNYGEALGLYVRSLR